MGKNSDKNQEGENKATEAADEKKKYTVEQIGEIVASSGWKHEKKTRESSVDLLKSLADFMTIEGGGGETHEDRINALVRDGLMTEADGKKALAAAKTMKKAAGGVNYDEESRKAINFSRTCVSHVHRLLKAMK